MIVKAGLEDMEDIYNLMCILENKELDKEHFVQTYQQNIQDEDVIYLVYKEDRILGFISFVVHHYLHHDRDMGEIVELVVLPECRGKRIGQQLLQEIEKKAIDLHLEQIELSHLHIENKLIISMNKMIMRCCIIIIQRIYRTMKIVLF